MPAGTSGAKDFTSGCAGNGNLGISGRSYLSGLQYSASGLRISLPAAPEMVIWGFLDAQTIPNLEFSYVECLAAWPQVQGRRAPLTPPRRCCPPGAPPARPRRASLQWRSKGCWEFWESLLRLRPRASSLHSLGIWSIVTLWGDFPLAAGPEMGGLHTYAGEFWESLLRLRPNIPAFPNGSLEGWSH